MSYIEKIEIKKWRHVKFNSPLLFKNGINLVLGKNGSGKTSLLKMISDASNKQNQSLDTDFQEEDGMNLVAITLKNEKDTFSVINQKNSNTGRWISTDLLKERIRYITSQRSISSGQISKNPLAQQLGDITISSPGQTIDVAEEFHKAILNELYKEVVRISGDTGYLKKIESEYQNELVDFEKTLKIDPSKENAVCFIDHNGKEISVTDLSSGEQEYLYFYSFLRRIQGDEGNIILIDEPELHLHSSQIRKLCELISNLSEDNQIIIATHSGEVLQHFISRAKIILLSKGTVNHIDRTDQMQKVLEETGLPVDPSVFTSHWICAENEPSSTLFGRGPTTPEALSWLFGQDLKKRYWSFGSNRDVAMGYSSGIDSAVLANIKITPILDGDKLIRTVDDYLPASIFPKAEREIVYFPFWELENIFLFPELLDLVIKGDGKVKGFDIFWSEVYKNKLSLLDSIRKTVVKNQFRGISIDRCIEKGTKKEIKDWQDKIHCQEIDFAKLERNFEKVIDSKNWKWIPGKEALKIVISLEPDFWKIVRVNHRNELKEIFEKDKIIKEFIKEITDL